LIRFVAADARPEGVAPAFLRVSAAIGRSAPKAEFFWGATNGAKARVGDARRRTSTASIQIMMPVVSRVRRAKRKGPG
jgi:hypothetical protein